MNTQPFAQTCLIMLVLPFMTIEILHDPNLQPEDFTWFDSAILSLSVCLRNVNFERLHT